MEQVNPPFWRTYTPISRLGWTTLALSIMWPVVAVLLALCALFLGVIVLIYPIVHYMWGMKSDHSASHKPGQ